MSSQLLFDKAVPNHDNFWAKDIHADHSPVYQLGVPIKWS
jgi:hypothetical protein